MGLSLMRACEGMLKVCFLMMFCPFGSSFSFRDITFLMKLFTLKFSTDQRFMKIIHVWTRRSWWGGGVMDSYSEYWPNKYISILCVNKGSVFKLYFYNADMKLNLTKY